MKRGDKVVCINDKVPLAGGAIVKDANLTEGEVYVVRWYGKEVHYTLGTYYGVKLEGIDSKFGDAWATPDCAYDANRFRPVVEPKIETKIKVEEPV